VLVGTKTARSALPVEVERRGRNHRFSRSGWSTPRVGPAWKSNVNSYGNFSISCFFCQKSPGPVFAEGFGACRWKVFEMSEPERILFVDDDAPVRAAFQRSLRRYGFEIDLAAGHEEAMEAIGQQTYAVIATDYRMPQVNGLDLIETMRQVQPDATYMLVSGECDLDLAIQAVNDHAVAYVIRKPWDVEELASVLKRSFEQYWERSSQRQVQRSIVSANRELEEQKERIQHAIVTAENQMAEALLSAMDIRGHETRAHCQRVAAFAMLIAEQLGLRGSILTTIRQGALLHDVGKIGIPDSILLKNGPLDREQWEVMRTHTEIGSRMLGGFEHLSGARTIVSQHHERWDGSGYPRGLKGEQIFIGARIFALADTLDAILSDRPYRKAIPIHLAVDEVQQHNDTLFDPKCVEAFMRIDPERLAEVMQQFPEGPRTRQADKVRSAA